MTLKELEKRHIIKMLEAHKNKAFVARVLGISQKSLFNKINEYGLREKFIHNKKNENTNTIS